ncbi:Sensor protein CpxA [Dermatophilus congolensis]|uniref:histidine kinase n=1 Tax=Dermatophilus congolensis TaxID=1863 RepID=A0AA46H158_9MICO|nr:ATP-binding protein [Dermatophilus congolensis]STD13544.1 Sensor protein CpxA [Dermatophilus congolensis]
MTISPDRDACPVGEVGCEGVKEKEVCIGHASHDARNSGWHCVRARLTVSFLLALVIPLLALLGLASVMVQRSLDREFGGRLLENSKLIAAQLVLGGPDALDIEQLGPDMHRVTLRVTDERGRVVIAHPSQAQAPIAPTQVPFTRRPVLEGTNMLPWGPQMQLMYSTHDVRHGKHIYRISLSIPLAGQVAAVRVFTEVSLAVLPMLLLGAGVVVWLATGRALKPVEEMRLAAERISAQNLTARLPVAPHDDEVTRLANTLNDMLSRLEKGRDRQRQFVSDASHELRSPLTNLQASIQLGQAAGSAQRWNELAPIMEAESARLAHLVDDLLTLSRSDERGGMQLEFEDVDLDDVAYGEVIALRSAGKVDVVYDLVPARVTGAQDALARAVRNLSTNATRAAKSRVRISTSIDGQWALLAVEDDGQGVPESERERIFDRFVRLDEARHRDAGGSGLGLPIVSEIIRAHSGTVKVDSSPSLGGARFTLRIPLQT